VGWSDRKTLGRDSRGAADVEWVQGVVLVDHLTGRPILRLTAKTVAPAVEPQLYSGPHVEGPWPVRWEGHNA
jgi:hypothetical protein